MEIKKKKKMTKNKILAKQIDGLVNCNDLFVSGYVDYYVDEVENPNQQ